MDANPLHRKALALEPIQDSKSGDIAGPLGANASAAAKARRDLHITTADEFLAAAVKEYQDGQVDPALWRLASDQSGHDASLVIAAYLRARASVLKRQCKQHHRPQEPARTAAAAAGASDSEPSLASMWTKIAGVRLGGTEPRLIYLGAGAVALVSIVTVVLLIAWPHKSEPVRAIVSKAAPAIGRSAPPTAQAVTGGANADSTAVPFETKVQELKKAGNWNVLVIYATDWTRKEPKNVAAWRELSVGYANLRQFGDALDAANRAVQMAPDNSSLWSNLGHVNLTFERLPEAGMAFDRALALSADDLDALCGAAVVAQRQGRPNDADALAKRLKSGDVGCAGVTEVASVVSAAGGSTPRKPVPAVGR